MKCQTGSSVDINANSMTQAALPKVHDPIFQIGTSPTWTPVKKQNKLLTEKKDVSFGSKDTIDTEN